MRDGAAGDYGPAPVPRTGLTVSYGDRDDGELQKGVEWPDPRFTDNLDGTVTDNLTGLIWLQDANRIADLPFVEALVACNNLADDGADLTDGSVAGAWRLPNIWEFGSLWDYGEIGPALPVGHPFINAGADPYAIRADSFGGPARRGHSAAERWPRPDGRGRYRVSRSALCGDHLLFQSAGENDGKSLRRS